MKFVGLIICFIPITITAIPIDEASLEDDQCAVCNDFIDFIVVDEEEFIPNKFIELLIFENFQEACIDGCGISNDLKEEFEYDDGESDYKSVNIETESTNLIKLAGCNTCEKILNITAFNSHGFDFSSIKYSLRHSCENIKGILDTVKCKLFIKIRESKILQAIYKFKKNTQAACGYLKQC